MINKVGLIGHFGGKEHFVDGQTVKTKALLAGLRDFGDFSVSLVDTYYLHHRPILFLGQFLNCVVRCNCIIICVSSNGRRVLFPLMYWMSRIFHKRIYHCAIGGRLADEVKTKRKWKWYIRAFERNWVESRILKEELQAIGVENARYLPNFKSLPILKEEQLPDHCNAPFRFCIFSRVMQEKGVEDGIEAVRRLNWEMGENSALLDIYGPIELGYEECFLRLVSENQGVVKYCGVAQPEESVGILKEYDMLLFPTHRNREGIPGTIIDALSAGLPVIARKWRYCDEMLVHGQTGYCYPIEQEKQLLHWMRYAVQHPQELQAMRVACLKKANEYRTEYAIALIKEALTDGKCG